MHEAWLLRGCIRLVLAANNDRMLAFDEELSAQDLDAVARRFLHINTAQAKAFLASLGGRAATEGWIARDMIAAHALWLRDNRKVQPSSDGRFLVEGTATRVHRQLATQGSTAGLVIEWLARFLDALPSMRNMIVASGFARVEDGELLVNTRALTDFWGVFIKSPKDVPGTTTLGRALGNLAKGEHRIGGARYHVINMEFVFDWAETQLMHDLDKMRTVLQGKEVGA